MGARDFAAVEAVADGLDDCQHVHKKKERLEKVRWRRMPYACHRLAGERVFNRAAKAGACRGFCRHDEYMRGLLHCS